MKTIYRLLPQVLISCCFVTTLSSCDDYLDVLPDNRAELDTDTKITELLVNAYPLTNSFLMSEMYSDNTDLLQEHCRCQ